MGRIFYKYLTLFLISTVPLFSGKDQHPNPVKPGNVRIASPAYDFTFKQLFKQERFLISFLNSLLYPDAGENDFKIRKLTYNEDASIPGKKYKHIYFDISCTCEAYALIRTRSGHGPGKIFKFDVEMQRRAQEAYYKRSVFYGARLFTQDTEEAESYSDIPPVKVISFLRESSNSPCEEILYRVTPTIIFENSLGETVYKKPSEQTMEWFYIQLDKIPKDHTLRSAFDEWITFLNIERSGSAVENEKYAYDIPKDQFLDTEVKAAVNEMENVVKTNFTAYLKTVQDEIADSKLDGEKDRKIAIAKAQTKRAKLIAIKAKNRERIAKRKALKLKLDKMAERRRAEREKARADDLKRQLDLLRKTQAFTDSFSVEMAKTQENDPFEMEEVGE